MGPGDLVMETEGDGGPEGQFHLIHDHYWCDCYE
jgi:hypothetical protein